MKILLIFVAFSEYMNFNQRIVESQIVMIQDL